MTAKKEYNDEEEIDILALCKVLWSKALLMVLAALIAGAATLAGTYAATRIHIVADKYEATASMCVINSKSITSDSASYEISSPNVMESDSLVETCIFILESRTTLEDIIAAADLPYDYEQLSGMITVEAVKDTAAFTVKVVSESPAEAELIANTVAKLLPGKIDGLIGGGSVRVVDTAVATAAPSSMLNYAKNALIGALVGLFVSAGVVTVQFIISDVILSAEDLKAMYPDAPVLALIPDMCQSKKKGYYYSFYYGGEQTGETSDFASNEAFKRLRTNVMMSFDGGVSAGCRVIGVTSAQPGEGKSTVALNLAGSLAELGKRVLLIDADMRRPSLNTKLGLKQSPGLSELLGGTSAVSSVIQKYGSTGKAELDVIPCGDIPQNPSELLDSAKMEQLSAELRAAYDYIVIDTSSVSAVIDAVPASKQTDGVLVVMRENSCHGGVLRDCVEQLNFAHVNMLGFVVNGALEGMGKKYQYNTCT